MKKMIANAWAYLMVLVSAFVFHAFPGLYKWQPLWISDRYQRRITQLVRENMTRKLTRREFARLCGCPSLPYAIGGIKKTFEEVQEEILIEREQSRLRQKQESSVGSLNRYGGCNFRFQLP
jgi:hypothetical protein